MQTASLDLPATPLTAGLAPRPASCHRFEKVPYDATSAESSAADDAVSRRAASESCLLSLANFTESLSYRHAPSPPPAPTSERKRSKTDDDLSPVRRRRKNRRLFAFEEEYRWSLSADDADDSEAVAAEFPSRSSSPLEGDSVRDDEDRDALSPLEMQTNRAKPSSSSALHPQPHMDVGKTYATDHLMMAAGMMTTIPLTPTRGMAGVGTGFLGLGTDKCPSTTNGGFWVLQS